jgi:DNA polymerase delta subunit 1
LEATKQGGRGFVNAQYDPVTQIGCTVTSTKYGIMKRCVFSLGTLSILPHDVEGIAMGINRQGVMLGLPKLIREYDVDIMSGYNIDGFDWPYLYQWAKTLMIDGEFMDFSRDLDRPAYIKKKKFNSRGTGTRVDLEMGCVGRCNIDTMKVIKSLVKLRSYGLGNVAQLELGHSKVEMPYHLIPEYQNGTDDQRAHLAYYCWMDAHLCHDLWEKRQILVMCVQQARVCKIPLDWLYSRGQQIRGDSQLLRRCQLRNFIIPTGVKKGEKPDGAKVLDPVKGFHTDPVVTLDLQSLYPTIIRFYNICYSTVKALKWLKANLKPSQYNVPPGADYGFVDETVLAGILPEAETDLAAFRQQAKAMLKAAKTLDDKVLYNKLQEAIKLVMNSLYGYTYADSLPDGRLTAAVTAWGREILESLKKLVESTFPGSEVIYGDTDSIFVKFKGATEAEAWDLGQKAAELCTTMLNESRTRAGKDPLHLLQREKLFGVIVLVSKKRYAGSVKMTPKDSFAQKESGMETVRRDNALFASEPLAKCLQLILMEGDHKGERCVAYIHEQIRDLFAGRVDISKLIISKNLSKDDYAGKQPHVEVAKKMKERNGDGPVTGDRVKFVMVARVKGTINADAAEDPIYAMENRLPLDYDYYIENQMMKPLLRIMHLILDPTNPEKKLPKNEKDLKNLKAYKILFTGEHMRYRNQHVVQRTTGISSFFVTQNRCLSCRAQCGSAALCKSCDIGKIRQTLQQDLVALQERQAQCLETCRACVKDPNATNIPCANNDCDNFYRRIKVVVDIEDVVGKLNRF